METNNFFTLKLRRNNNVFSQFQILSFHNLYVLPFLVNTQNLFPYKCTPTVGDRRFHLTQFINMYENKQMERISLGL